MLYFAYLKWEDIMIDFEGQKYIIHSSVRTKRNCYEKNWTYGMKDINGQGIVKPNMDDLLLRIRLNFGGGPRTTEIDSGFLWSFMVIVIIIFY